MNKHIQKLRRLNAKKFWVYFLENKEDLKLILDNDDTIVVPLKGNSDEFASSPTYLGTSDGICDFLTALNIEFEYC